MKVEQQRERLWLASFRPALVWGMVLALMLAPVPGLLAQSLARPVITPAQKPSQPVASTQQTGAAEDASTYRIGAQDHLQITVWQEPSLSGTFPVRPDGKISLVLLGDVPAAGMTPMDLAHELTVKLKKYIQDPVVSVVVTTVDSQRIYLVGEVQHTGPIVLTPGMTLLQAIASAGGLTPYTNGKHSYILRGPQGHQQKIPFNYKAALKGDNQQDVPLMSGDTIVVP